MRAHAADFRMIREHDSVLAASEKRLLVRMAGGLPKWVNSDHLTFIGAAAMLGIGLCYWAGGGALLMVIPLLALNWFGDSLDGTLARVRKQERPRYGYYVDHVIDIAGGSLLFGGIALSGVMNPLLALALLSTYLLVSAETYLATHARGVFKMAFLDVGP